MGSELHNDDWRPCRRGELQRLRLELPRVRRSARLARLLGGIALVGLLAATWWGWRVAFFPPSRPADSTIPVSISCPEVLSRLVDFRNGAVPAELARRIERHLERCDYCRNEYSATCPDRAEGSPRAEKRGP